MMTFLEKITGSDITKEMKSFEQRAEKLPQTYQEAWDKIQINLWEHSDFTGRNLLELFDNVLCILEDTAADHKGIDEVLGNDIRAFCDEIIDKTKSQSYREKWRRQLNDNVAKKLKK